jgi:hypothetical protein
MPYIYCFYCQEEFKDTKVLIRIRISKKNRQNNGQRKKDRLYGMHQSDYMACISQIIWLASVRLYGMHQSDYIL